MATNAKPNEDANDDLDMSDETLQALKDKDAGVETEDETLEDEPTDEAEEKEEESEDVDDEEESEDVAEDEEEAEADAAPSFVKEFPQIKGDTPEEYAKNLEAAYKNSTAEALRLKGLAENKAPVIEQNEEEDVDTSDPTTLYFKQKMEREIQEAFTSFQKDYPQVNDPTDYQKFVTEVDTLSRTILATQKRMADPSELYTKAAVILGWEKESTPTAKDKLDIALKDKGATTKTTSGTKSPTKSKVTDAQVKTHQLLFPDKSDAEVRKELEAYV